MVRPQTEYRCLRRKRGFHQQRRLINLRRNTDASLTSEQVVQIEVPGRYRQLQTCHCHAASVCGYQPTRVRTNICCHVAAPALADLRIRTECWHGFHGCVAGKRLLVTVRCDLGINGRTTSTPDGVAGASTDQAWCRTRAGAALAALVMNLARLYRRFGLRSAF